MLLENKMMMMIEREERRTELKHEINKTFVCPICRRWPSSINSLPTVETKGYATSAMDAELRMRRDATMREAFLTRILFAAPRV